ncbi:ABC transporter substrate-binding protein [Paenibacillus aurantiacus]|uniref:ABC transporter substrate-binding protein n=1 Tax=Paenibacillus aurantiacus TaxID=1936118 RepID=A0ABV5KR36_9BACL
MRALKLLLPFTLIAPLIGGCFSSEAGKPVEITVNYPDENGFYQKYGYEFEKKHPGIKIRVETIDVTPSANTRVMPDIVFMDTTAQFQEQLKQGALLNLQKFADEDDSGNLDKLSPIMTDLLRNDDGQLHALSPYYSSQGIYYNKGLFKQYGVPLPKNQMSWRDLLELAQRFPKTNGNGERMYGFVTNYYREIEFATFLRYGQTEGLCFINPATLKIAIDTPQWRDIYKTTVEAFRSGAIKNEAEDEDAQLTADPLLTGHAAMQIYYQDAGLNMEAAYKHYKLQPIDWDVVTPPVNPLIPEQSDFFSLNEIFGISAKSAYPEEAWEFLEFAASDVDNVKRNMSNSGVGIPATSELNIVMEGHDTKVFSMLRPATTNVNPYDAVHYDIVNAFKEVGQAITEKVIKGELPIDDALQEIEKQGQAAVDKARAATGGSG